MKIYAHNLTYHKTHNNVFWAEILKIQRHHGTNKLGFYIQGFLNCSVATTLSYIPRTEWNPGKRRKLRQEESRKAVRGRGSSVGLGGRGRRMKLAEREQRLSVPAAPSSACQSRLPPAGRCVQTFFEAKSCRCRTGGELSSPLPGRGSALQTPSCAADGQGLSLSPIPLLAPQRELSEGCSGP